VISPGEGCGDEGSRGGVIRVESSFSLSDPASLPASAAASIVAASGASINFSAGRGEYLAVP
jgi:uncharacterized protein (DUF2345 family)